MSQPLPKRRPPIRLWSAYTAQLTAFGLLLLLWWAVPGWVHRAGYSMGSIAEWGRLLFESPFALRAALFALAQVTVGLVVLHTLGYTYATAGRLSTAAMVLLIVTWPFVVPVPDPATLPPPSADTYAEQPDSSRQRGTAPHKQLDSLRLLALAVPEFYYYEVESGYFYVLDRGEVPGPEAHVIWGDTVRFTPLIVRLVYEQSVPASGQTPARRIRFERLARGYSVSGDSAHPRLSQPMFTLGYLTLAEAKAIDALANRADVKRLYLEPDNGQLWLITGETDTTETGYVWVPDSSAEVRAGYYVGTRRHYRWGAADTKLETYPLDARAPQWRLYTLHEQWPHRPAQAENNTSGSY